MDEEFEPKYDKDFFVALAVVSTLVGFVVAAVVACFF